MNKESACGSRAAIKPTYRLRPKFSKRFGIFAGFASGSRVVRILLLAAGIIFSVSGWAATLLTDKPDYVPGEHVTFSGTGWQPGQLVTIDIYETSDDPLY